MLLTILTAFASGVFGSCIGALASIVMCALVVLVGIGANAAGANFNIISNIGFGMLIGPQVSFAPACCALVYAWKKGYLENSHDIFTPLIGLKKTDVLVVGGIFGILGWYMNAALERTLGSRIDCVALTVTMVSIIGKWLFGGSPIGKIKTGARRFGTDSPCWLPWQTSGKDFNLLLLGITVSVISADLALLMCNMAEKTGNSLLASASGLPVWAVGLILLLFMATGRNVPVFHHIGLCSALAAKMIFNTGGGAGNSMLWAVAVGTLTAYLGDWLAKLFDVNGEGYVDPPTAAIAVVAPFVMSIFEAIGAINSNSYMRYIIPTTILLILLFYEIIYKARLKNK